MTAYPTMFLNTRKLCYRKVNSFAKLASEDKIRLWRCTPYCGASISKQTARLDTPNAPNLSLELSALLLIFL
jgi:hypothetical protein